MFKKKKKKIIEAAKVKVKASVSLDFKQVETGSDQG